MTRAYDKPTRTERQENPRKRNVPTMDHEYDWLPRFYCNMNAWSVLWTINRAFDYIYIEIFALKIIITKEQQAY